MKLYEQFTNAMVVLEKRRSFFADLGAAVEGWRFCGDDSALHGSMIQLFPDEKFNRRKAVTIATAIGGAWRKEGTCWRGSLPAEFGHVEVLLHDAESSNVIPELVDLEGAQP